MFFTRNGSEIGQSLVEVPPSGFYPTVGVHNQGASVRVNLRAKWPPEQDDEMIGECVDWLLSVVFALPFWVCSFM